MAAGDRHEVYRVKRPDGVGTVEVGSRCCFPSAKAITGQRGERERERVRERERDAVCGVCLVLRNARGLRAVVVFGWERAERMWLSGRDVRPLLLIDRDWTLDGIVAFKLQERCSALDEGRHFAVLLRTPVILSRMSTSVVGLRLVAYTC